MQWKSGSGPEDPSLFEDNVALLASGTPAVHRQVWSSWDEDQHLQIQGRGTQPEKPSLAREGGATSSSRVQVAGSCSRVRESLEIDMQIEVAAKVIRTVVGLLLWRKSFVRSQSWESSSPEAQEQKVVNMDAEYTQYWRGRKSIFSHRFKNCKQSLSWKKFRTVKQEVELSVPGCASGFRTQAHSPNLQVILKQGFLIKPALRDGWVDPLLNRCKHRLTGGFVTRRGPVSSSVYKHFCPLLPVTYLFSPQLERSVINQSNFFL